ncbi:Rrf2 family transcriptional regulator [Leuconostocaceae bacterium ESL0958]|nr:Rrf2 family transcriptional regulator [Leuconostocaceae bacterium ESL0958]
MKASVQFSDAIHILAYLTLFAAEPARLSSQAIADSVHTNAANVRKIMALLKKGQLIETQVGKAAPKLSRPPEAITFTAIYRCLALSDQSLFPIDQNTEGNCPVGAHIQSVLKQQYARIQAAVEAEMDQMTLADVVADLQAAQ